MVEISGLLGIIFAGGVIVSLTGILLNEGWPSNPEIVSIYILFYLSSFIHVTNGVILLRS